MNRDYLIYEMNAAERAEWNRLAGQIKADLSSAAKPRGFAFVDFVRAAEKCFTSGSKGYAEGEGFYSAEQGDRGGTAVLFEKLGFDAARCSLISTIVKDALLDAVNSRYELIRLQNEGKWRYRRVYDRTVKENGLTRRLSHTEEQSDWVYDTEYDYRLYWFEPTLFVLKQLLPAAEFSAAVTRFEGYMNTHLTAQAWHFQPDTCKFALTPNP